MSVSLCYLHCSSKTLQCAVLGVSLPFVNAWAGSGASIITSGEQNLKVLYHSFVEKLFIQTLTAHLNGLQ